MEHSRLIWLGFVAILAAVGIDQASKWYLLDVLMQPPQNYEVFPFFHIVLTWNKGISFGFLPAGSSYAVWALVGVAVAMVLFLLTWLFQAENRLQALSIGLVIGGAIGNVIDRIRFGAVTDFIYFHYGDYYFPAFNAADSFITIGVGLILIEYLIHIKNEKGESTDD